MRSNYLNNVNEIHEKCNFRFKTKNAVINIETKCMLPVDEVNVVGSCEFAAE